MFWRFVLRLRGLLRTDRIEHELDEELRFHLERQIEDNLATGMSPAEARYKALRSFGGLDQTKEKCRAIFRMRFLETLWQDVRQGLRILRKNPGFSTLAVLALALGIGANSAIFSVVNAVLVRPLPYHDPDRLMRVHEADSRGSTQGVAPPNLLDLQEQNHSFEHLAAYTGSSFALTGGREAQRVVGAEVSTNLFSLLGVNPERGRTFTAEEGNAGQERVAIISHSLWRQLGGDPNLVGTSVTLDAKSYIVIGIMPPQFVFPIQSDRADIWTPLVIAPERAKLRGAHFLDVVGRLKANVSIVEAKADLETIEQRIARDFPKFVSGRVQVMPLKEDLTGNVESSLLLLLGAVTFVLLIAVANVANLLLARGTARQREIGIRVALGATRGQIIRQLLTESVLLALIGGIVGLLLTIWVRDALLAISPADVPRIAETARRALKVDPVVALRYE